MHSRIGLIFLIMLVLPSLVRAGDNLIPNPRFEAPEESPRTPYFWYHGSSPVERVKKSEFTVGMNGNPTLPSLGIRGGGDREGEWWTTVEGLERGGAYVFAFRAYREEFEEGVYPEVEIQGQRVRFNNHLVSGAWQDFSIRFTAVAEGSTVKFINNSPVLFLFASPLLVRADEYEKRSDRSGMRQASLQKLDFFPLITYGAETELYPLVRDIGFHGVVVGVKDDTVDEILDEAESSDLFVVARSDSEAVLRKLAVSNVLLGWYVEDEPEGRSVPVEEIEKKVAMIRGTGSNLPTFMAMVRPEFAAYYRDAADVILMDQYPVPNEPLIWLSKSMDGAKRDPKDGGIWAVIQMFGGQGWRGKGWDREPTREEMRTLSYLAIVHGARGLFFYTIRDGHFDIRQKSSHLMNVRSLIQELRHLSPIFLLPAVGEVDFKSDSLYASAPDGTKPVHARMFADGGRRYLVAVNVLDKPVDGRLLIPDSDDRYYDNYFTGKRCVVKDGNIIDTFEPYEVKLYIAGRKFVKIRVRDGRTDEVKAELSAEVAETAFEKKLGLMFRPLPSDESVLFFTEQRAPREIRIHALHTKEPFDLIFLTRDSRVGPVFTRVWPCTRESDCSEYSSAGAAAGALELRAGTVDMFGIERGDLIELH